MKHSISILFFLLAAIHGFSQGWEHFYGGAPVLTQFLDVVQLPDGDYLMLGKGETFQSRTVTRTDEFGIQKWQRSLPSGQSFISMFLLPSGNIELISNHRIIEIDTAATVVSSHDMVPGISTVSVTRLQDAYLAMIPSVPGVIQIRKIDLMGGTVWEKTVSVANFIPGGSVTPTQDGGFLFAAANTPDIGLAKFDVDGNIEWITTGGAPGNEGNSLEVITTQDGGYAIIGAASNATSLNRLYKFDENGVLLWWTEIPPQPQFIGLNGLIKFFETTDGGFAFSGTVRSANNTDYHPAILKLSSTGILEFLHIAPYLGSLYFILQTNDGGYQAVGQATNITPGSTQQAYAIKLGASGYLYENFLQGQVGVDENMDCLLSAGEQPLRGWIVKATGTFVFYDITDVDGHYSINVDTDVYTLEIQPPNNLWSPCENHVIATVSNLGDIVTNDFPVQAVIDCPAMQVDIGTPFLRLCFDETKINVLYCNYGTVIAEDASIEVTLDDLLEFGSSTLAPSGQTGNTFTFEVGDLDLNECGSFQITATVSCEAILGQSLCMEAHAYPDTICGISFNWSGASMVARAHCEGDSVVVMELENVGNGPTSEPIDYIVIEDQIIFMQGSEIFESGGLRTIEQAANGATWRITSEQEPNHPGNAIPTAFVEGCGTNEFHAFSTGFINEHPLADGDGFYDMDCEPVVASCDPNDKSSTPTGYGAQHYIKPNTDLEYRIRFQNTGTDTAFLVVIRDTLSPNLDPATIRVGAASHNYEFDLEGDGIAIFRFNNILLPDSNVNEALSHGFVNFSISQKPDVALGSVIENEAAIYFDFNAPVITNQVFHTVNINFIEIFTDTEDQPEGLGALLAYPNPSAGEVTFKIPSEKPVKATFALYDQLGRRVLRKGFTEQLFRFNGAELSKGVYFYKIEVEGLGMYTGKIVLN